MKTIYPNELFTYKVRQVMVMICVAVKLLAAHTAGAQTPVHAWSFEDGTARDTAGSAHGALQNGASIIRGNLVLNQGQYVELPAYVIEINEFSEISVEAWFTASGSNFGYHMLWYFGNSTPDPLLPEQNLGTDCFFFSPARGDNMSRTAISTGETATPWLAETGVNGQELDQPGTLYHVVSVVNDTAVIKYINGVLTGYSLLSTNNSIDALSNAIAWLGRSGYSMDGTWEGWIHGVNIYDHTLSPEEVNGLYNSFPEPHDLTVSDITTTIATLEWSQLNSADAWDIAYGPAGFDPDTEGTRIEDVEAHPFLLTDLSHSTKYEVYVRAVLEEKVSNWSLPATFVTKCLPAELPLSMGFDNSGQLPVCWDSHGSGLYNNVEVISWNSYSAPNSLEMAYDAGNVLLIAPEISEDIANTTLRLMVLYSGGNDVLEIGVVTNAGNPSSFIPVENIIIGNVYDWQSFTIYMHTYNGPEGRLAIRYGGNNDWGAVIIDDMMIEQTPDCPEPYNLSAGNITTTSAHLQWLQAGAPGTWNVEWGITGFTQGGGSMSTGLTDNSTTLSELVAGTAYEFYVQADCGDGTFTPWVGPFSFQTNICEAENQCMYQFELLDMAEDGWDGAEMQIIQDGLVVATIGPEFVSGATHTREIALCPGLDFEVFWSEAGWYSYEVGLKITGPDGSLLYNETEIEELVETTLYQDAVTCGQATSENKYGLSSEPKVYPNPFSSQLHIRHAESINRVVITTITGQKVFDMQYEHSNQQTIDTGELSSGVYIVVLYTGDEKRTVQKLIKK